MKKEDWLSNHMKFQQDLCSTFNAGHTSYIGFILALSGVFLSFTVLTEISELFFVWCIICIVIGYYTAFFLENRNITKTKKEFQIMITLINEEDKKTVEKSIQENNQKELLQYEKILKPITYLIDIGQLFFLLGIISLVICKN